MRELMGVLLLAFVAPAPAPQSTRVATGEVVGAVLLVEPPVRELPSLGRYARRRAVPPAPPRRSAGVGDVVVYLVPEEPGRHAATPYVPRIVQADRTIVPFLTVAQVGQRVEFPNQDDVFHNLFSLSEPNRFDLGRYAPGEARSHVFDHAGAVRLFCDIHSNMAATILVLDSPYHTRPDVDGRYRIEGVPAGRYLAIAWHDRAGADSARIVVPASGTAATDFSLGT
jgi:hypothetical protein